MYTILTYGFPFILIAFEWGLKFILEQDNVAFVGPALAAAALSFLMPLTKPKVLEVNIEGHPGSFVTSTKDSQLIGFTWILTFLFLFIWSGACYFSIQNPMPKLMSLDLPLFLGLITYGISMIMTLLKEKL